MASTSEWRSPLVAVTHSPAPLALVVLVYNTIAARVCAATDVLTVYRLSPSLVIRLSALPASVRAAPPLMPVPEVLFLTAVADA